MDAAFFDKYPGCKMMRMLTIWTVIALVSYQAGAVPDMVEQLVFSTTGADCYSDGSHVLQGECYALVWKADGSAFSGLPFLPPSPDEPYALGEDLWLVDYFPVAQASADDPGKFRCPEVTISAGHLPIWENANGTWTVYLLDTRYEDVDGTVRCGFDPSVTNMPERINAYTPILGLVDFKLKLTKSPTGVNLVGSNPSGNTLADQLTYYHEGHCRSAHFADVWVGAGLSGRYVFVSVTNTAMNCQYLLSVVPEVGKVFSVTNYVGGFKWGIGVDPLVWEIPVESDANGFFRLDCRPTSFRARE